MKYIIILGIIAGISVSGTQPEEKKKLVDDIKINADTMEYDTSHQHADAKGNVTLSHVIKNIPINLKCNTLHVEFNKDGSLDRAIAEGDVEIDYNDTNLCASKCEHNFKTNHAVCTGDDVKLIQHKNEMHGTEATLDFPAQVFTMQSNDKAQISGVFYPKEKTTTKGPKL